MKEYRVIEHPDKEGFPNCWHIQVREGDKFKFYCGYFKSKIEAEFVMNSSFLDVMQDLFFNKPWLVEQAD